MYYSEEVIEEVRTKNDIVDVISGYVRLQKKGSSYFGLCPFHNEKSPSFSVSPQKQMYYCFGCGKGGNVITFVMDYENESFQEAVASLAERAGIELPQEEESEESRRQADYRSILSVSYTHLDVYKRQQRAYQLICGGKQWGQLQMTGLCRLAQSLKSHIMPVSIKK